MHVATIIIKIFFKRLFIIFNDKFDKCKMYVLK